MTARDELDDLVADLFVATVHHADGYRYDQPRVRQDCWRGDLSTVARLARCNAAVAELSEDERDYVRAQLNAALERRAKYQDAGFIRAEREIRVPVRESVRPNGVAERALGTVQVNSRDVWERRRLEDEPSRRLAVCEHDLRNARDRLADAAATEKSRWFKMVKSLEEKRRRLAIRVSETEKPPTEEEIQGWERRGRGSSRAPVGLEHPIVRFRRERALFQRIADYQDGPPLPLAFGLGYQLREQLAEPEYLRTREYKDRQLILATRPNLAIENQARWARWFVKKAGGMGIPLFCSTIDAGGCSIVHCTLPAARLRAEHWEYIAGIGKPLSGGSGNVQVAWEGTDPGYRWTFGQEG